MLCSRFGADWCGIGAETQKKIINKCEKPLKYKENSKEI